MYYRVAFYQSAIQVNPSPTWQWKSTALSELAALFQFLRLHRALPQDRLRVFSSSSSEDLDEQLGRENQGLASTSVTAAHFLQERMIRSPEVTRETPECNEGADRRWQPTLMGASAARSYPPVKENGAEGNGLVGTGRSALEKRREELERGGGGDHDIPYQFTRPSSMPQVLAWMEFLVRVYSGTFQP
jgi:hypothetical protein